MSVCPRILAYKPKCHLTQKLPRSRMRRLYPKPVLSHLLKFSSTLNPLKLYLTPFHPFILSVFFFVLRIWKQVSQHLNSGTHSIVRVSDCDQTIQTLKSDSLASNFCGITHQRCDLEQVTCPKAKVRIQSERRLFWDICLYYPILLICLQASVTSYDMDRINHLPHGLIIGVKEIMQIK